MTDIALGQSWMQKHPTPSNAAGDFHWHGAPVPPAIRSALADAASRAPAGASVWLVDGAVTAWARTFQAVSPGERRRYTGLAAATAQAGDARALGAALPDVLARLPVPPGAPWREARGRAAAERVACAETDSPHRVSAAALRGSFGNDVEGAVRALVVGGAAGAPQPGADDLPARVGDVLSWLPAGDRARPRTVVLAAGAAKPGAAPEHVEILCHYLARALAPPAGIAPGQARCAWQLVLDLAHARGGDLAALFAALTRMAAAWESAAELHAHLLATKTLGEGEIAACDARAPAPLCHDGVGDAGWLWNRALHYWGRGFLAENGAAGSDLAERLARLLAMRVTADHLFHLDRPESVSLPGRYLRRLRYEALLPRERAVALLARVHRILPHLPESPP